MKTEPIITDIKLNSDILNQELNFKFGSYIYNYEKLIRTDYFLVNLIAEYQDLISDLNIPIEDYKIPENINAFNEGLIEIINASINNKVVFFGCFGGIGRTGIVLACLNKIFNNVGEDLIIKTREYLPHALETNQQMDFVNNYDVSVIQNYLKNHNNINNKLKVNF